MTTSGEGGIVTTNDEALWSYKDHGKSWDAVYNRQHAPGFRWLHDSFGTHWRMSEMQGVIGSIQTARMLQWQKQRLENAERIWDVCSDVSWLCVPAIAPTIVHAVDRRLCN